MKIFVYIEDKIIFLPIFFQNDETLIFRQILNIILPKNFFSNVIVNFELNLYNSNFCSIFPLESYFKKKTCKSYISENKYQKKCLCCYAH